MLKGQEKKTYSDDQKSAAVEQMASGTSAVEVAKSMGISTPSLIYSWRNKLKGTKPVKRKKTVKKKVAKKKVRLTSSEQGMVHVKDAILFLEQLAELVRSSKLDVRTQDKFAARITLALEALGA